MSTPTVAVNDGKHKLIVAEEGERVLTPEQNRKYEMGHPRARKEPMKANVVFDQGGDVPSVGERIASRAQDLLDDARAASKPLDSVCA
jgi:hypothetical protein